MFTGVPEGSDAPDLYVYTSRATLRRLTSGGGAAPAWSSRNRIVYVAATTADALRTLAINPDGSGRRRLTRKNGLAPTGRRTAPRSRSSARAGCT